MALPGDNLLVRLHKWAERQDENFLTEAFAYLLQHLLDQEPEAAVGLLAALTDGFFQLRAEEARLVEVCPHRAKDTGTPDLEVRTAQQLALFEVKAGSEPNLAQLRRYRGVLRDSGCPSTRLILLTRYPTSLATGEE
jgi:hypothetical protein